MKKAKPGTDGKVHIFEYETEYLKNLQSSLDLLCAIEEEDNEGIDSVFNKHPKFTLSNKYGVVAFMLACETDDDVLVERMIKRGAPVNFSGYDGLTPLIVAIKYSRKSIARLLIKYDADISAMNRFGDFPLSIASSIGNLDIIEELLLSGADVNKKRFNSKTLYGDGKTALMIASGNGCSEVVNFLLQNGADPNVYDQSQKKALNFSAQNGYVNIVMTLLNSGTRVHTAESRNVSEWIKSAAFYCIRNLNQYFFGKNYIGIHKDGLALIDAAMRGENTVVRCLLDYGVCVNSVNSNGVTPLMSAVKSDKIKVVKYLVDFGASINERDYDGYSALDYAKIGSYSEIFDYLCKNGAAFTDEDCMSFSLGKL